MSIQVLVVDDSALMRKIVKDILLSDPAFNVISTANNGKEAVEKTISLNPDVITMDVEMPVMNGIEAVKEIMKSKPTPIIMLSALTSQGAETTIKALSEGALDFICKPSGSISVDLAKISEEIILKVKTAASANVKRKISKVEVLPSSGKPRKVLIVDSSDHIRKIVADFIDSEPDLEILDQAVNSKQAIEKVEEKTPDVILMDIEMPDNDGLYAVTEILKRYEIPIVIFSGKADNNLKDVKLALELGAVDFITKPPSGTSLHLMKTLLLKRLREAKFQRVDKTKFKKSSAEIENIVLIGSSTGGPQTLERLIPQFPKNIPAGILIVQHMPEFFTKSLADRLNRSSSVRVKEAEQGDEIKNGIALLAPGNYHMTVYEQKVNGINKRFVALNKEEKIHGVRPSVDITFSSAVNMFKSNTVGIILTGMGRDGANSMGLIKAKGGHTIAQDKDTSIIFGMPDAAIKLGVVDRVLPLDKIPYDVLDFLSSRKIVEVI